jgi:hypothetical protein
MLIFAFVSIHSMEIICIELQMQLAEAMRFYI